MNELSKLFLASVVGIGLISNAYAHDPKMHVKKAEKAKCSNMDHSKMDMKNPVVIAMMKKCMKQAKASANKMDHSKMDHSKMKNMSNKKQNEEDHKNH